MAKKNKQTKPKSKIEKFWGAWNTTEAILLMIAGILGIVVGAISVAAPENGDMQKAADIMANIVPFVTGVFIVMDAIMRIIISFTKFRKETDESAMMIGAFEITVGIILMIFFQSFTELVADFVAIFMICIGVLLIIFSIMSIARSKTRIFIPILEIVFSAALIAIGTAIIVIYYQDSGNISRQRLVLIITGAILFITGIVFLIMTKINRKKQKRDNESQVPATVPEEEQQEQPEPQPKPKPTRNQPEVIDLTGDNNEPEEPLELPLDEEK